MPPPIPEVPPLLFINLRRLAVLFGAGVPYAIEEWRCHQNPLRQIRENGRTLRTCSRYRADGAEMALARRMKGPEALGTTSGDQAQPTRRRAAGTRRGSGLAIQGHVKENILPIAGTFSPPTFEMFESGHQDYHPPPLNSGQHHRLEIQAGPHLPTDETSRAPNYRSLCIADTHTHQPKQYPSQPRLRYGYSAEKELPSLSQSSRRSPAPKRNPLVRAVHAAGGALPYGDRQRYKPNLPPQSIQDRHAHIRLDHCRSRSESWTQTVHPALSLPPVLLPPAISKRASNSSPSVPENHNPDNTSNNLWPARIRPSPAPAVDIVDDPTGWVTSLPEPHIYTYLLHEHCNPERMWGKLVEQGVVDNLVEDWKLCSEAWLSCQDAIDFLLISYESRYSKQERLAPELSPDQARQAAPFSLEVDADPRVVSRVRQALVRSVGEGRYSEAMLIYTHNSELLAADARSFRLVIEAGKQLLQQPTTTDWANPGLLLEKLGRKAPDVLGALCISLCREPGFNRGFGVDMRKLESLSRWMKHLRIALPLGFRTFRASCFLNNREPGRALGELRSITGSLIRKTAVRAPIDVQRTMRICLTMQLRIHLHFSRYSGVLSVLKRIMSGLGSSPDRLLLLALWRAKWKLHSRRYKLVREGRRRAKARRRLRRA